jgi:hypothetical protein
MVVLLYTTTLAPNDTLAQMRYALLMMNQRHIEHLTRTRRNAAMYQVVCSMGLGQSPTNLFDGIVGPETSKDSRRTTQ